MEWEQSFSGFNLGIGVLADLEALDNPIPLKVGFSFKTPFDLDITTETTESSEQDEVGDEFSYSIDLPSMIGLGVSYRLGEFLTLAADFELRGYGGSQVRYEDEDTGSDVAEPLSESEEDILQFRFGAEYLLVTDFAVMPFRIGFRNVPTLLANYDSNDEPESQVVGFGFTVGSGFIMESLALDFTYSYTSYKATYDYETLDYDYYTDNIFTISAIYYLGD